ncbi:hypothetical protein [Bradyrhizobium sp. 5.13L]
MANTILYNHDTPPSRSTISFVGVIFTVYRRIDAQRQQKKTDFRRKASNVSSAIHDFTIRPGHHATKPITSLHVRSRTKIQRCHWLATGYQEAPALRQHHTVEATIDAQSGSFGDLKHDDADAACADLLLSATADLSNVSFRLSQT